MSAFDDIEVSGKAAGEAPAQPEIPSSETPAAQPATPEPEKPQTEPEKPAGEGAEPPVTEGEQTTEDETQFLLTGRETPEQLKERHGDSWAIKTARRALPLVEKAGGMQNLRNGAELISIVQNPEMSGLEFLKKVEEVSPTRAKEIRNDIVWAAVDSAQELILQDIFKIPDLTLAEAKKAIETQRQWNQGNTEEPPADDELSQLPPALKKELEELRGLKSQVPELQSKVTGFESDRQKEEVNQLGKDLYTSVFSVVEERKKKLGLDILPTDSDEVKDIKNDLQALLSDQAIEDTFMGNEENARLSDRAIAFLKKRDRNGAFAYRDTLAVAAEVAFEQMLRDGRVARKLSTLKSVMESQSKPKDPTARDEIVAGAAAGFSGEDPFAAGLKEGKSPFDVSVELAGRQRVAAR